MPLRHFVTSLYLTIGLTSGVALAANPETCAEQQLVEVNSLTTLPASLRAQLGSGRADHNGIADRGEKFNATDLIDDATPMQRFVLAGVGEKCALVALERGGRGYWLELRVFALTDNAWKELHRKTMREIPKSVPDLVVHASKSPDLKVHQLQR